MLLTGKGQLDVFKNKLISNANKRYLCNVTEHTPVYFHPYSFTSDLVTYLENISVTQCISGFSKIWTPTT